MTNIAALARPNFGDQKVSESQTAEQIKEQLQRAEYNSRSFSREVAPFFKKKSDYDTCQYLWQWLRNNIQYYKEPKEKQTAKTIERFIVDGYGDCKHYATTSVGVLNACDIPAWFVLVGQRQNVKKPNHAYCCALVNGKVVVIDPCRKEFDSECKHFYKWNYAPIKKNEIMALHYLSGDEEQISGKRTAKRQEKKQGRQEKRAVKKTAKQEKKTVKKAARKEKVKKVVSKAKGAVKKVTKSIVKVGVAPARTAFLTVVTLNGAQTAMKLARIYKKPGGPAELQKFWTKFGGDFGKLKQAIAKGAKQQISGDEMGSAVVTAIATATPILIALVPLIQRFKAEGDANEAKAYDDAIQQGKEDLASDPNVEESTASMPEDKDVAVVKKGAGGNDEPVAASFFSPLGLYFKVPLLLSQINPENAVLWFLIAFVSSYCTLGMVLFPFYQWNWLNLRRTVTPYIELPKNIFYVTIKKFGFQKK